MKKIGHWTPRYIVNRIVAAWRDLRYQDTPWLSWDMIRFLDQWLQPTDVGFEWGSGRSTAWFAKRMKHLTSIENHKGWFERVSGTLIQEGVAAKTNLRFIDLSDGPEACEYVRAIDEIADGSLTLCLVDSHKRDLCALRTIPKLASGGVVIVDDVQRYLPATVPSHSPGGLRMGDQPATDDWKRFAEITKNWRCIWYTDGLRDTALWIKP